MNPLNRTTVSAKKYTEKILQFGGGNFLRGFVDWMVQILNEETDFDGGVIIVKPTKYGNYEPLKLQDGLFTVVLEGIKNGVLIKERKLIDCVQNIINPYLEWQSYLNIAKNEELRFIVSNTTEAGIIFNPENKYNDGPPKEFPAKLTILMYHRFEFFSGDISKGFIVLPCELIENNGEQLKECILKYIHLWELGEDFKNWIHNANTFCNTLVDRIVSGYPKNRIEALEKELDYQDNLMVAGEYYHSWILQAPEFTQKELPFSKTNLNVKFVENLEDYRSLKVRILNGAHTSLVPVGFLYGIDRVRESLEDEVVGKFLKDAIFDEICPTLDFPEEELKQFTKDILDRFRNPYLEHELMSISLNSISKFKTRVLPSILEFIIRKKTLPKRLLFSLAALIVFYKGHRNGEDYIVKDDQVTLDFFKKKWATNEVASIVKTTLSNTNFWGEDLTKYVGLENEVIKNLDNILNKGMNIALQEFSS